MKNTLQHSLRGLTCVFAASLAASLAAQSSDPNPTLPAGSPPPASTVNTVTAPKLSHHDRMFLEKAAKGGMKEVAVSQAVMDRLTNPQVRDFANTMVTDHTAANTDLMALAAAKGVTVMAADPKLTEKWSEKSGELDKKYINEMVGDHESAVKLFEKASKSDDPDIAAFAQKTLPTLMHHLSMAKDLKDSLKY